MAKQKVRDMDLEKVNDKVSGKDLENVRGKGFEEVRDKDFGKVNDKGFEKMNDKAFEKVRGSGGDFEVEIGNENGAGWSKDKLAAIRAHIQSETAKKTDRQRLEIELLSIQYQMEDYLEAKELEESERKSVETFIKLYLAVLKITFKSFATSIDTTDGNLKKYLSGERKISIDLALKFAYFFHTPPDLWLRIQMKNELQELEKEKDKLNHYKKYNYERLIA